MNFIEEFSKQGLVEDGILVSKKFTAHHELISEAKETFFKKTGSFSKSTAEVIYFVINDLESIPSCSNCDGKVPFLTMKRGYNRYCSRKCSATSDNVKTNRSTTNLQKYGCENVFQNEAIKNKIQATVLEHFGVLNPSQNKAVREKAQKTMLDRYGVEHAIQNAGIKKKTVETNLLKYGVKHALQLPEYMNKQRSTNIARRGVEYPTQDAEVREKIKQANLSNHGMASAKQMHYSELAKETLFDEEKLGHFLQDKSMNTAARMLGVRDTTIAGYIQKYNLAIDKSKSSYEREISSFLLENELDFEENTRKIITPYELDFYIPEHKLGIEFNGLYWHSNRIKENQYHYDKWNACKNQEIRLIMIYEDEWIRNQCAIKSKILNLLGKSEKGVGARKLSINRITPDRGNKFSDCYHIQGASSGICIAYGAFYNENLISVMLFNKQRGTQNLELVRFCTDGKIYAGLFSKMFKTMIDDNPNIDEIISFADLRYSIGNLYEVNDFEMINYVKPDYRYVVGEKSFHKKSFTKSLIHKKFGLSMENLTEREAMEQLNIPRIYDCGKLKFRWTR